MQSSPRWILGCLLSLVVFGFGVVMVLFMALSSMESAPVQDQLVEIEVEPVPQSTGKIAVIKLMGVISSEPPNGGLTGYALKALKRATEDAGVRVILLEIDSPGGGVTDSDRIHHAVENAKKAGKKVYAFFGNLCASGGYYIAVAANEIWSRPTSITGSIGVIVPSFSAQGLLQKLGVVDQSVRSGDNKQILGVTKDMNTEQRALVQGVVDAMYDRFVGLVAAGRGLTEAVVKPLADGRLYSAKQALDAKLIDQIGYRDELLTAIRGEYETPLSLVRYQGQQSLIEMIVGSQVKIVLDRMLGSKMMSPSGPSYLLSH